MTGRTRRQPHRPMRWIEVQRNDYTRVFKPVYHNSDPIDVSNSSGDILLSLMSSRYENPDEEFEEGC